VVRGGIHKPTQCSSFRFYRGLKRFYLLRFIASRIAVNFEGLPPFSAKFCHEYATNVANRLALGNVPPHYVPCLTYDRERAPQ
jgi:hypothetical protein